MRKFSCHAAGIDCPWTIYSDTEEDVVRRARDHVVIQHGANQLADDEERIRQAIKVT